MSEREDVRDEVREWLAQHWDPERPLLQWRELLVESGWGCPSWPTDCYGRDLPGWAESVVAKEFDEVGAVGVATGAAMTLTAPTLIRHGTPEQLGRLLRPIVTGEHRWCQLFSEPGSGSDLAGLTTRANRDGDRWTVTGQKVWNSGAHAAAYGMLLARTNWDVPKHQGITYFALPMDQAAVEVRPLRQMNGYASFNEVFLDGAEVPAENVIGAVDGGWEIALTTLSHERAAAGLRPPRIPRDATGQTIREARAEADAYYATYSWYPQRAGRPDLVVEQAQYYDRIDDPVLRQDIARLISLRRAAGWTMQRAAANRAQGRPPGPEGSLTKLVNSRVARASNDLHAKIAGTDALRTDAEAPRSGVVAEILLSVPAVSIAGGTDEIQRSIVAERVLGLPKEPSVDTDRPFRDVRTNTGSG